MTEGRVALVVFTRDLRITDNPALVAAARESDVVCAFVHDDALRSGRPMDPRRTRFLRECLWDLDDSLRRRGAWLEEREGRWVETVLHLVAETGASTVHLSEDVTPYSRRRLDRLEAEAGRTVEVCRSPGLGIVAPGAVAPVGGDHYKVFTPYYRRWLTVARRPLLDPPAWLSTPRGIRAAKRAPDWARDRTRPRTGGERAAEARLAHWDGQAVAGYGEHRDDLAEPRTSGLSADLHFGCLSPLSVESALAHLPGSATFLRQLCWRDFYFQVLAARPEVAWSNFVERGAHPRTDPAAFEAWCLGLTGVPVVDAVMRQLTTEGYISNRARMIAASFLTRRLGLDWRDGAKYFLEHLVDADVALNNLNWQWMAGKGMGTNPNRVLSPTRQAFRFDPHGTYVRRHVPELRDLDVPFIHEPWRLGRGAILERGYRAPIVELTGEEA